MNRFAKIIERWIGDRPYEVVAPLLGAAVGTVHGWRHGTSLPPASRIPALATALGVPEAKLRRVVARDRTERHGAEASSATSDAPASTTPAATGVRS